MDTSLKKKILNNLFKIVLVISFSGFLYSLYYQFIEEGKTIYSYKIHKEEIPFLINDIELSKNSFILDNFFDYNYYYKIDFDINNLNVKALLIYNVNIYSNNIVVHSAKHGIEIKITDNTYLINKFILHNDESIIKSNKIKISDNLKIDIRIDFEGNNINALFPINFQIKKNQYSTILIFIICLIFILISITYFLIQKIH